MHSGSEIPVSHEINASKLFDDETALSPSQGFKGNSVICLVQIDYMRLDDERNS